MEKVFHTVVGFGCSLTLNSDSDLFLGCSTAQAALAVQRLFRLFCTSAPLPPVLPLPLLLLACPHPEPRTLNPHPPSTCSTLQSESPS